MNAAFAERLRDGAVRAALDQAESLGVFPPAAVRILAVVDDPRTSLVDLERAVELDPVLTAQVLKIANSAFFGLSRSVGTLRHALFILGFRATRDLALALAVMAASRSGDGRRRRAWQEALQVGLAMRLLAWEGAGEDSADRFTVGLLHNIGALLLHLLHGPAQERLLAEAEDACAAERFQYGFDHVELGAACLERWNLPEGTCGAVRWQQRPWDAPPSARQLPGRLWLAVRIQRLATGAGGDLDVLLAEAGRLGVAVNPVVARRVTAELPRASETIFASL